MTHHLLDPLRSLGRDLAHATRSLIKDRGFTLVCVVSLGIGIGSLVALATFARAITAPARVINTDGLVELLVLPLGPLRAKAGEWALEQWSYPDYQALRDANTGMALTAWVREFTPGPADEFDESTQPGVTTMYVAANYFQTFGVSLARGAGFDPIVDDATSAEPRVIVSDDFWRVRLAADPEIVGKPLMLDGSPHTVVGVTPADFRGHFHFFQAPGSMVFVPLERHPRLKTQPNLRDDRTVDWLQIHGRLDAGVALTRANALVSTTMAGLAERHPATNEFKSATVEPYTSMGAAGRPESRRVISVMLALAGTVLLIVCLNISGMMLVRGASRERELSIRAALGAGRRSLIGYLFFEAVLLAVAAGAISAFVLFGIPAIIGWRLGVPVPPEIDLDLTGIAISSGLCLLVSVLFGLLPALRFSRPNLIHALKENAAGGGRQNIRVHRVAALVQIGIAVPFLVVSGVMLDRVRTAELGFQTDGLAAARLPASAGPGREAGFAIRKVRDDLKQTDGVLSVAVADGMPVDFDYRMFRVANTAQGDFVSAQVTRVGENFLETIGARLVRGRTITAEDGLTAAPVAVVSQPLADQLFPGDEPIGQRVTLALEEGREEEFTIVGVTADFATSQLTTERPQILLPLPQTLTPTVFLIARGAPGDEPKLTAALEGALRELGVEALPGVAFPGIVTGQELVEKSLGDLVSESTAVGVAGGLVLILAALGIVGVVGFMVATRTRELAVRMALGATRMRVLRMMLSDVVKLVVPGVAGGLLLGAVLIRSLENVMGTPLTVGPTPLGVMEPIIYAGAAAIAIAVALLAGLPAARRATTVQPMVAMRSE
ncbi:MAG: ABC transporter permease [Acidobacteriota bacterium]|nr:ABC transporter permease [Acidobacteriota bacterium]